MELMPVKPEDAGKWAEMRRDREAKRFMPMVDASVEELARRLQECTADTTDMSGKEILLSVHAGDCLVGFVGARNASRQMRYAEISYLIDVPWRGKGIAQAAVRCLIDKLFASGYRRLFATISVGNVASIRVATKVGFVHEGTLRQHHLIEGRPVDQEIHGLLDREWTGSAYAPKPAPDDSPC